MIDLRVLRYFQAVAEELSFSRAAQRLRVAQPALSRTIKELEEQLGVVLLARTRRSVALTPAGRVLLNDTGLLLQRLDETFRHVQRTAAGEEGELRLGYIGPPTQIFLGAILREFRARYPRVALSLEERTPERVWEMVARGRLDIGLTRPVLAQRAFDLKTLDLRNEPLWAVLPEQHALARNRRLQWRDLKNEPLIILARREGVGLHDTILECCRRARFEPHLAHTPSLMTTVLSYVEAGEGIGVMTDTVTSLGAGRPVRALPLLPTATVDLVMVWSGKNDSPVTSAFKTVLEEWVQKGLLWRNLPREFKGSEQSKAASDAPRK
jgi:DNA-binding transcriptional LysR family regulator